MCTEMDDVQFPGAVSFSPCQPDGQFKTLQPARTRRQCGQFLILKRHDLTACIHESVSKELLFRTD